MINLAALREFMLKLGPYFMVAVLPGGFLLAPLLYAYQRRQLAVRRTTFSAHHRTDGLDAADRK